ncbi:aminotransferase [Aureimonas psammosilenae]|uniref:aminotransferase n=1 Tax=Aureimonas psammosilenae TaxID=2495496 RepID=UPI0012609981|nr:aminotransferase [Aureimonas psammosilenae]
MTSRLAHVSVPPIAQAGRWAALYDGRHGALIDCSQAVPNRPPPPELAERLASAAASAGSARYGEILGDRTLRAAYAAHVSERYRVAVDPSRVAITSGCNQAFFATMVALGGAGDAVILPVPWYFNHLMTLQMLGLEARPLPLDPANGFLPDALALEALIDERTKAVVLVSPNNPTGAVYPDAVLAEILALCARHGLTLVLDETYRDFLANEAVPHSLFGRSEADDHLVALYSFSKTYAIPGHRAGALVAGSRAMPDIEKVIDCIQICAPRGTQAVLPWAIESLGSFRKASAAEIVARAEVFAQAMEPLAGWRIRQIGAYFAYVEHPFAGEPSGEVSRRLAKELGIVTLPGSFFGPDQERFLRIAFANVDAPAIAEMARRLALPSPSSEPA